MSDVREATDMQSDWFIREVRRCMEIGMPLGCCDEWPECSHVLAWVEKRQDGRAFLKDSNECLKREQTGDEGGGAP